MFDDVSSPQHTKGYRTRTRLPVPASQLGHSSSRPTSHFSMHMPFQFTVPHALRIARTVFVLTSSPWIHPTFLGCHTRHKPHSRSQRPPRNNRRSSHRLLDVQFWVSHLPNHTIVSIVNSCLRYAYLRIWGQKLCRPRVWDGLVRDVPKPPNHSLAHTHTPQSRKTNMNFREAPCQF